jgi:predicted transcriptional regulator
MKTAQMFGDENVAITMSRMVVQEYVDDMFVQGRLSDVAKDEAAAVSFLARTSLSTFVVSGQVKKSMIERWLQEAMAAIAQPKGHNVLTGEIVYKIWSEIRGHVEIDWSDPVLAESVKIAYDVLAAKLMDILGICYICGEHGDLSEQEHMMVCSSCAPYLRQVVEDENRDTV